MAHISVDLYEGKCELQQLIVELQEMKLSVNTQQALTLDYAINIIDELVAAAE